MFRPDRIGTPAFHDAGNNQNIASFSVSSDLLTSGLVTCMVTNAVPHGEYGRSQLYWTGAARTIPALSRITIVQQFSITQPIDGDVVGIECMGSLTSNLSAACIIRPVFGKLTTAAVAIWGAVTFVGPPTGLNGAPIAGPLSAFSAQYQAQVIHREDRSTVAGTYAHGFQIINNTAGAATFTHMDIVNAERQLNYQEAVGYRDTLR